MNRILIDDVAIPKETLRKKSKRASNVWTFYKFHSTWEYFMLAFNNAFTLTNIHCYVMNSHNPKSPSMIHHILCLIFIGLPITYMKLYLGYYTRLGVIMIKILCPIVHGIGYITFITNVLWCSHFGLILSDFVMYFTASLDGISEFTYCPPNSSMSCWDPLSSCTLNCIDNKTYPAAAVYWQTLYMDNLNVSANELLLGKPMATRFVPLIICWVVLFTILIMDTDELKKIIKTKNYIILFFGTSFMLVCFLTEGSSSGIRMMFRINSASLLNFAAWSRSIYNVIRMLALERVCYMMYGTHLGSSMSSDMLAIVSVLFIFATTLLCGVVAHSLIGIVMVNAHIKSEKVEHRLFKGTVPYFTVFVTGIGFIGVSQLWAVVYFITCIMILSNNLIVQVDALESCLSDTHIPLRAYRNYIRASLCIICAIIGLIFSSKEAFLLLNIMFKRVMMNVSTFNLFLLTAVVFWIYGVERLSDDIHFFRGMQPTRFWKICWYFIPSVLIMPCIYTDFLYNSRSKHDGIYYSVSLILKLPLLIFGIYEIFNFLKIHHLLGLIQPEARWGPKDPNERHLRHLFNPRKEIRSRRRIDTCEHVCLLKNQFLGMLVTMENNARDNFIRPLESNISFSEWNLNEILEVDPDEIFD